MKNTFWKKEQDKTSEKELNETEINNLPGKEFKIIVTNMLTKLGEEWTNSVRTSTRDKNIKKN